MPVPELLSSVPESHPAPISSHICDRSFSLSLIFEKAWAPILGSVCQLLMVAYVLDSGAGSADSRERHFTVLNTLLRRRSVRVTLYHNTTGTGSINNIVQHVRRALSWQT